MFQKMQNFDLFCSHKLGLTWLHASSGAHAREDYPDRDDEKFMKHTLSYWDAEKNECKIDYRNVHQYTLDDEMKPIPPSVRTY